MQKNAQPSTANYREEALLCALRARHGEQAGTLLRRHPRAAALASRLTAKTPPTLAKLFSDELEKLEAQLAFRSPPRPLLDAGYRYWARRRFLGHREKIADTLPEYWGKLVKLSRAALEKHNTALGLDMIGYAMLLESPERVIRWLEVLGNELARHVVDQFDRLRHNPINHELAERWHFGFGRVRNRHKGPGIAQVLGCSLLALMYRRLPHADRVALEPWYRANLEPNADRAISEELCPGGQEKTVSEVLGRLLESEAGSPEAKP